MKILIFSENCSDAHKESIRRITDKLKRRGHAVHSLSVMQEDAPSLQQPSLRRRMMQKKYHEAALREYAGKLKKQLEADSYDVIIACHITCAKALSTLYQSEECFFPFMVYVSSGDELPSSKQLFSCDAYIVRSENEKNTLVRREVATGLIHLLDAAGHESAQICEIIENEGKQWEELKRVFYVGLRKAEYSHD